jgi:hypothetical protein
MENEQHIQEQVQKQYLINQLNIIEELQLIRKLLSLQKQVLNLEEFCLYAGISKNQAYHLTSNKKVKFYRPFGKMIYFDLSEVIEFLEQNHVFTTIEQNRKINNFLKK